MKAAHFRTVSIPCNNENSGGGGVRSDEKESNDNVVSVVLRNEASISNLLLAGDDADDSQFHGRMVAKTTTGRFSFRILAINSGSATAPWPTGNLCRNNRITVFGCVDIVY